MPLPCEIIVDPHLLCLPNPCKHEEQLVSFIEALLKWKSICRENNACTLFSSVALRALGDDGEYPHRHELARLMAKYNCAIATVKDVDALVRGILNKAPFLEDYFGIDTVLIDESTFSVSPPCLSYRLKPNSRRAFAELLTTLGIVRLSCDPELRERKWLASSIGLCSTDHNIQFAAQVNDVSYVATESVFPHPLPYDMEDTISLALSYDDLLSRLGLSAVWNNCADESSAISTIDLFAQDIVKCETHKPAFRTYTIGKHFCETARMWPGFSMTIVESCARIVLNKPKKSVEPFREEENMSSKQRVRKSDGALAFRTHLTGGGLALRLMLWVLKDGTIEFANVGVKAELVIL